MLPTTVWNAGDAERRHGAAASPPASVNPSASAAGTDGGDPLSCPVADAIALSRADARTRARTALDLWSTLLARYLATRAPGASASGEPFPETSAGDVRRVAVEFSRQLCLPQYDFADLSATRAAWRDAEGRVTAICRAVPWSAVYPENERFWLSDALALAQRLAAIDIRRNSLVESRDGVLTLLGDRSDPLTTWQDLRAYFLARRPIASDRGWRYPETTVSDVAQIAHILDEDLRATMALGPAGTDAARALAVRVAPWRAVARDVHTFARQHPREAVYPDNARFWRAARSLAIWMSVGVDVARADAERPPLAGWR
ncbi:MAG TPA: hypothetical protein VHE35_17010 [Kofleriaceae bacterium]|nr:hypothetical protein [Kofleriaceae bacterium]